MSLRERTREEAFRPRYETGIRKTAEQRYRHSFSPRAVREMERSSQSSEAAEAAFRAWIWLFTFDGGLLLAAFLFSAPLLLWLGEGRWIAIWSFAMPPLAFFGAYLVVGAPLYRYQAGLHAFMLPTVLLGATTPETFTLTGTGYGPTGSLADVTFGPPISRTVAGRIVNSTTIEGTLPVVTPRLTANVTVAVTVTLPGGSWVTRPSLATFVAPPTITTVTNNRDRPVAPRDHCPSL